ncbi:MAG: glycosyltransferase family 39 protein [Timaviella obliquedivisa GSE-PSE-MK23-08B]|nr:glycosyltransferase family 39 protein [Timaviella obliquedivisa GSE-PSE-MK23-08B]
MPLKVFPRPIAHYLLLFTILLLGLGLRFWHLDSKPLWLDEVLSALFTMGRSYQDIPREEFFPLTALDQLFTLQPGITCPQIAQTIATQSVHPPLFFCLMHRWLNWLQPNAENWVWAIRSLPALLGVGAIGASYYLNRVAFSKSAGLASAALMAVSPFAVYLSQEARHYTLPMLLITLALAALVQMQQDLTQQAFRPWVWLGWVVLNSIGLYVHYFFALAVVAQVIALGGWMGIGQRRPLHHWGFLGGAIAGIVLCYLPWLPTLISHTGRPETDWLIPYKPDWLDRVAPLYQTVVGWVLMIIALPVENQSFAIKVASSLTITVFGLWLISRVVVASRSLWKTFSLRPAIVLLLGFTLCVILEFFAIVYVLDKDITVVPRYNFVYYPGICALLGACFGGVGSGQEPLPWRIWIRGVGRSLRDTHKGSLLIILLVGLISSGFVVNGWVFQKSYRPNEVAQDMVLKPDRPLIVVVSYTSLQDIALGLSFALELRKLYSVKDVEKSVRFAFFDRSQSYQQMWKTLARSPQLLPLPLNLWVVTSPGTRAKDYPERLRLASQPGQRRTLCQVDPQEFYRIGFPYQLYRCAVKGGKPLSDQGQG